MRLSRIIAWTVAPFAAAGVLAVAGVSAQAQQPYPPQPAVLTVSDPTVEVGAEFTLSGSGFTPGENIRLDFETRPLALRAPGAAPAEGGTGAMLPVVAAAPLVTDPGSGLTVPADSTGSFSVRLRFTRQAEIVITATGLRSGLTASVTLTVYSPQGTPPSERPTSQPTQPGSGLPVTGASSGSQLMVGGSALAVGVVLVALAMFWRRRARR